jgi:hypothetical protein
MGGCLIRMYWMILGNAVLALSLLAILRNSEGFFSAADIVFWCGVVALLAVRSVDILRLRGLTGGGEPATTAHLKRYIVILPAASAVLWGVAHWVSHLLR